MPKPQEHILFLTGKLAEHRLLKVLDEMKGHFRYTVKNIGVSVAALITTQMIMRRLSVAQEFERIIIPGLCRGDVHEASEFFGVPVERGPVDLKDLPVFFGLHGKPTDLSRYQVKIFAEITDAPNCTVAQIIQRAEQYRLDGANVIDLGCLPNVPFPHLEESIQELQALDYQVSVDSMQDDELLRGGQAGADYLLSLQESTLWIADEVDATPILIPEQAHDMASLHRAIEQLLENGRAFYADSILDPIHFGFTASIVRYHALRARYPDIDIMVGVGNLTELTEADTSGMNALLFGIISELAVTAVLTTEVSLHCRSAVREADWARRIMFAAKNDECLPKGLHDALTTTHLRHPYTYTLAEIEKLATMIKDPSYRVQISEQGICVYNRDGLWRSVDPYKLFPHLSLLTEDASHAFYMGIELAKAQIAWQLGRRYQQDAMLSWGAAIPMESTHTSHHSTAHSKQAGDNDNENP